MHECIDILNTFAGCLAASGADPGLAQFLGILLGVVLVAMGPLVIVIFLIWVERKYAARVQDRIGPNRVGPFGLLQTFADALKLITKEDITPAGADKVIYNLAPIISVVSVIMIWAVVPVSPLHIGVDLSIGVLYFVAISSVGTLAIMMAGWSSNNKYALLGAFRVVAQLLSYEVPLVFSLLVPVLFAGTMRMQGLVEAQLGMWYIVLAPLSAIIFFISTQAETGRAPFDLIEAESELVAGYNIEYSGMKFGLFFAGEFLHVFTNSLIFAAIFVGGWLGPFVYEVPALGIVYLFLKGSIFYILSLHLRNTLPRVRIDQLMSLNWKFLVPVSIANLLVMAFVWKVIQVIGLLPAPEQADNVLANLPAAVIMLLANVVLTAVVMQFIRNAGRRAVPAPVNERLLLSDELEEAPVASLPASH